jgi:hypothetical protein
MLDRHRTRRRCAQIAYWAVTWRNRGLSRCSPVASLRRPDLLQRAIRMDFDNYMAADIPVKTDRAA